MEKKRILHITECLGSGVLNYVKNITAWQANDYEVYIAYSTRPETPDDFMSLFDNRIVFICVEGFTREIEIRKDIKAFFSIRKVVEQVKPDLIHLHSTKAGILGRWAINCNRYNVFYSPHAYSFLMMDCTNAKRFLYKTIERLSNRKKCLTITDIDGELENSFSVTRNAICIANGINPNELDKLIDNAQKYREIKPNDKLTISMLGKVVPQKNPRLFNEIAEHFPDINFVWIGTGPLTHLLKSPNINITGWLSREEAIAKIIDTDIFLFPSAWESLSIALLEVMYIGKPCVVSTADGNRDVINECNGFVCEDLELYIKAIKQLILDPNMVELLGIQAHKDIIEKYNVFVMEKKYRELFKKIGL